MVWGPEKEAADKGRAGAAWLGWAAQLREVAPGLAVSTEYCSTPTWSRWPTMPLSSLQGQDSPPSSRWCAAGRVGGMPYLD